jgi:hypothetical protein
MSIQSNFPAIAPSLLLDFANTKQLDNRITFTRSTPAVYYDGKTTAMAEQNALLYSQDFSVGSSWSTDALALSANSIAAPDGTTTASTISNNASNSAHRIYQSILGFNQISTYSFSMYAKYKDHQYISFGLTDQSFYRSQVVVDLLNGTITQNFSDIASDIVTSAITSVGNGWYRITGTLTPRTAITTNLYFLATLQQGSTFTPTGYVGTGTGFYLWGTQAEQRNASTAYTATTTRAITNYIPVLLSAGGNQARFDCNPTTGESLGLFIEEQRTNLVTYSASFANWTKPNASFSTEAIAPDGTLTAQKVICTTTGSNSGAYRISSGANTISLYAKASGKNWLSFINTSGSNFVAFFNVSTGTLGTVGGGYTASIVPVGNGWFRCVLTAASGSFAYHQWCICDQDNDTQVTENSINGVLVWGAQAEAGSFATSYIATLNESATRTADAASMVGTNFSSWFNNAEGTLYAEASPQTQSSNSFGIASLTNLGGSANSISMYYTGGNVVDVESLVNNSVQYTYLISRGSQPTKVTHGYKVNDSNVALNGTAYTTDTVCNVPKLTALTIGTIYDTGGFPCNGTIRKIAYYPLRVNNTQLAALTS